MKLDQKILNRLTELVEAGTRVSGTRRSRSSPGFVYLGDDAVDYEAAHQWGISCLSLLGRVFGVESDYYRKFEVLFSEIDDHGPVIKALGILRGAKDDYERGFLFETRTLIRAEVFDDFLDQADHLFEAGYHQPAAVVGGSVLEDGLRQLCDRHGVSVAPKPKLDQMNADLAKQGVYSVLVQKRITTLADIRNKAAHGKWNEFDAADVEDLLRHVRSFMETHFV
jgi:hypothetical protein